MDIISKKPTIQPGQKFRRWTVLGAEFWIRTQSGSRVRAVVAQCECGAIRPLLVTRLLHDRAKSCGCLQKEVAARLLSAREYEHGQSHGRLHSIWTHMLQRCGNPKNPAYKDYGGRGIHVCNEWRASFVSFMEWCHDNGYADDLTIDRRDNNKGYSPDNCRWVGWDVQSNNTRTNVPLTAFGETKNVKQWWKDSRCAVTYAALRVRLKLGWTPERAISEPKQGSQYHAFGDCKSLREWSMDPRCVCPYQTLRTRVVQKRWTVERAITTPKPVQR